MRRLHAQLFHGVNFEVPYLNLRPSVLTLHDLSPWRNPAWHSGADRVRTRAPWLLRLGLATMAITPSEAIRREAIDFFGIAPDRIAAIPLAPFLPQIPAPPTETISPYFLFAGTLEPRKNLHSLVDAWRAIRANHPIDLVLAGRRRADGPVFHDEPGLRILGEVTDHELASLYSQALAFVYPSHYEGFGLPVLEAMQCGAVVIVSNDPALIEVSGGAALRADSTRDLAQAMRALIAQPDLRARHREKSLRRAAAFSWRETARRTHAVYQEALARFG
jgi:glycosyltransferase involved in cell wall biosynthesis